MYYGLLLEGIFYCVLLAAIGALFVRFGARKFAGVTLPYLRALGVAYLAYLSTLFLVVGAFMILNKLTHSAQAMYNLLFYPLVLLTPIAIFALVLKKPSPVALQSIGFLAACKVQGIHLLGMTATALAFRLLTAL